MCKKLQFRAAILGLLFSLGGLISASAAQPCPDTATHTGSGQTIGTFAKGSGINIQSGTGRIVAPCQVITVQSTVQYAGATTYAWTRSTATITPDAGLSQFG